jgi:hypothetical protein
VYFTPFSWEYFYNSFEYYHGWQGINKSVVRLMFLDNLSDEKRIGQGGTKAPFSNV